MSPRHASTTSLPRGVLLLLAVFCAALAPATARAQSYARHAPANPAAYLPNSIGAGGPAVVHRDGFTYVAVWRAFGDYVPHISRTDEATGLSEIVPLPGADAAPALPDGRLDGHYSIELKLDPAGYLHAVATTHGDAFRYWRSNQPASIAAGFTELTADRVLGIPQSTLGSTYPKLLTDNNGVLFLVLRVEINTRDPDQGERGVALYRHDVHTGRWTALGDYAFAHPAAVRGANTLAGKAIFWEWGGQTPTLFYQGFSANLSFDPQNRLHFTVTTWDRFPDADLPGGNGDTLVYARSDDGGDTWTRSDGTPITRLPMRGRAGLPDSAEIVFQGDPVVGEGVVGLQTQIVADRADGLLIGCDYAASRTPSGWTIAPAADALVHGRHASRHLLGADRRLHTTRAPISGGGNLRLLDSVVSDFARQIGSPLPMPDTLGGDAHTFRRTGLLYGTLADTLYARLALTPGWHQAELGTPGGNGYSTALAPGALRLRTPGGPADTASDQGRFTWQTISGDGVLIARLDSLPAASAAWAGLAFRENKNANARSALLRADASGFRFLVRAASATAAAPVGDAVTPFAGSPAPWLRLTRAGSLLSAHASADGQTWNLVGSANLSWPADLLVGLLASSGSATPADFAFSRVGLQGLRNVAFGKPAAQSSNYYDLGAGLATDGVTDGNLANGSVAMTYNTDAAYFWRVDLLDPATVRTLRFFKRTDGARDGQLNNATVRLLDAAGASLWSGSIPSGTLSVPFTLTPAGTFGVLGVRYVEILRSSQTALAELEVIGTDSVALPAADLALPATPAGLAVASANAHTVTLSWQPSASADVAGYVLQRASSAAGPFTDVAADIFLPRYADTGRPASVSTFHYRVAAFDHAGNRSAFSAPVSATLRDRLPPSPPVITTFQPTDTGATLGWTDLAPAADFSHWELVRADREGRETVVLARSTATSFAWTAPGPGDYAEFFLRAYDLAGNRSAESNRVSYLSGANLALGRPATQGANASSATLAVDGLLTDASIADLLAANQNNPALNWWQVDLGSDRPVGAIELFSRAQDPHGLVDFDLTLVNSAGQIVWSYRHPTAYFIGRVLRLYPDGAVGRHVRVQRRGSVIPVPYPLQLMEVRVLEKTAAWPDALPPAAGRVLHFDASAVASLTRDGYRVTRWANLATPGGALVQPLAAAQPRVGASSALERHLLDFGGDDSGRWLRFKDAADADWRPANLRTVFWVVKGSNFLLGDGLAAPFHRGTAAEGRPDATLWDAALADPAVLGGQTYFNGEPVNGATTPLPATYSVVSLVTTAPVAADRLGDDRATPGRQGGLQLAELLAYDTALPDAERRRVERHLAEKWNVNRSRVPVLAAPAGLVATAASHTRVDLSWTPVSGAVSYLVKRAAVSGGPYATVASGLTGTTFADTGLNPSTAYHYVVAAADLAGETPPGAEASANTLPPPPPWTASDVGAVGLAGSTVQNGSAYTIAGAGADLGGTADAAHFAHVAFTGDGVFTARLVSRGSATAGGKFGIAMRESLAAGARSAAVLFDDGQDRVRFFHRAASGGGSSIFNAAETTAPPIWLRLARVGDVFTGSWSADGQAWTALGSATLAMGATVRVGLIASSRNVGTLNTAVFDNLAGAGWDPPAPPVPSITVSGAPAAVSATYGQASPAPTSFIVSGANLAEGVSIAAPAGFEVSPSLNNGYASAITAGLAGTFGPLTIYLRFAATTPAGSWSGDVALSSVGAAPVALAVPASVVAPAALTVVAQAKSKAFGAPDPELTYAAEGLLGGDALSGALARAAGEASGAYAITLGTLSAGPNYLIGFTGATLTILPPPPTPFESWAGASGLTPGVNAAAGDDPDGDGLANLGEFALAGDPLSPGAARVYPSLQDIAGRKALVSTMPVRLGAVFSGAGEQVSEPVDGLVYRVQGSTDLVGWGVAVEEVGGATAEGARAGLPALEAGWTYRSFAPAADFSRVFLRARAEPAGH